MATIEVKEETREAIDNLTGPLMDADEAIRRLIEEAGYEEVYDETGETTLDNHTQEQNEQEDSDAGSNEVIIDTEKYVTVCKVCDEKASIEGNNQTESMVRFIQHLIDEHDLLNRVDIPYRPSTSRKKRLISDEKEYTVSNADGEKETYEIIASERVTTPDGEELLVDTHYSKKDKKSRLKVTMKDSGWKESDVSFQGKW